MRNYVVIPEELS